MFDSESLSQLSVTSLFSSGAVKAQSTMSHLRCSHITQNSQQLPCLRNCCLCAEL